jgi:hypothetical protein
VKPENRIREAIKQIDLSAEKTDQPDVLDFLDRGSESLENALESLEGESKSLENTLEPIESRGGD